MADFLLLLRTSYGKYVLAFIGSSDPTRTCTKPSETNMHTALLGYISLIVVVFCCYIHNSYESHLMSRFHLVCAFL